MVPTIRIGITWVDDSQRVPFGISNGSPVVIVAEPVDDSAYGIDKLYLLAVIGKTPIILPCDR